jgi:hypothetical protein
MVEEASVTRKGHSHFHAQEKSSSHHQYPTRASKRSIKMHIHDRLTFLKLVTTPLTMTCVDVLAVIKGKYFMQYPPPIKSVQIQRTPTSSIFFIMIMDTIQKSVMHS